MHFSSDNWAGAHPLVSAALAGAAAGFDPAYGSGAIDARVAETFSRIFEREVAVFFVATGTAANALALSLHSKPGTVAFCHREAHVIEDECGAPEFFADAQRLCPVDGAEGRIDPESLRAAVERYAPKFVHSGRPGPVTITQATEAGTVYGLDHIAAIGDVARAHGLALHMDGARFANALVSLDATAAEMTWKRGVDMVSFGGTKNGCWCAEAVVLFDATMAEEMGFRRKRAAQLFSKSRFIAAQFEAYFRDELWLETARHANAMAARLASHFRAAPGARLGWEPQANEVFAILNKAAAEKAQAAGATFYPWHAPHGFGGTIGDGEELYRFVTSFATTAEEVDRFGAVIGA